MNLIVVCVDTFRADMVGEGKKLSFVKTPNLDALAAESVVFDRCFGEGEHELDRYAWFRANSGLMPHPVGEKTPNAFGLYDVHGNVLEWCSELYDKNRHHGQEPDSPGDVSLRPDNHSPILRGGPAFARGLDCRSAWRLVDPASGRGNFWGFRVARTVKEATAPKRSLIVRLESESGVVSHMVNNSAP